jgi:hypothetical protein
MALHFCVFSGELAERFSVYIGLSSGVLTAEGWKRANIWPTMPSAA